MDIEIVLTPQQLFALAVLDYQREMEIMFAEWQREIETEH